MTEAQQKLWKEMLNSDLTGLYFAKLASRFSRRDINTKVFLAVMSSGTVAGWGFWNDAEKFPMTVVLWKIASGIAALTSITLPFLNYPKKVEWATSLRISYQNNVQDFEMLWLRREKISEDLLLRELQTLITKEKNLSALEAHFPEREENLLHECQREIQQKRNLSP